MRPSRPARAHTAPTVVPSAGVPSSAPEHAETSPSCSPPTPDPSTPPAASGPSPTSTAAVPPPAPDIAIAGPVVASPANHLTHAQVQQTTRHEQDARDLAILDALQRGEPYRKISAEHRISLGALSALAQRLASIEREGVAKLMALKSLEALEHWETAMKNGAKQGKHAPARDWLTHARALDPVQSEQPQGAKVAVIIGMPGAPVDLPSVQVIDTDGVVGE